MPANEKPHVDVPDHAPSYQLELEDLEVGEGEEARPGSIVEVHYVGVSWSTSRQFDASWDRGETFKFGLGKGQVIRGWDARRLQGQLAELAAGCRIVGVEVTALEDAGAVELVAEAIAPLLAG